MNYQHWFIAKSKDFRIHFQLTEADVDALLINEGVSYTGLELGTKTLTLDLAEAYPSIYGLDYCDFKKDNATYPSFESLPQKTKDHINNRAEGTGKNIGLKGTKNKASYVIFVIKQFKIGQTFSNFDIVRELPSPLSDDASILWNNGILKGLVKATKQYQTSVNEQGKPVRSMVYEVVKVVDKELLEKAKKNVDKDWLKNLAKKNK